MPSADPQLFQTAVQHHKSGRLQQAEAVCRQMLAANPANTDALNLLGVIAIQIGRYDDALRIIRSVLALKPDHPFATYNLANALLAKGQTDEAIFAYQQFLAKNPAHFPAYCNLGAALLNRDRPDDAISAFRKAIALNANLAEAHYNLGTAYRKKEDFDQALASYQNVLALMPRYPDNPHPGAAARSITDDDAPPFLASKPDFAQVLNVIGLMHKEKGDYDNAIASFKKALEINSRFGLAYNNLGYVLRDLGQFNEAAECLRQAAAMNPKLLPYRGLVFMGRQMTDANEILRLKELVNQPDLPVDDRIDAEFALGKLFDEEERFDDAFAHFATANHLFKQSRDQAGVRFSIHDLRRQVDQTIQDFTPPFFSERHSWGNPSEVPVFIVGMPRSGTTLVEQIAASHPSVFGAGELSKIRLLSATLSGSPTPGHESGGDSPFAWGTGKIAQVANEYLEHVRSLNTTALRITDKMPANVFHLGFIAVLFPNARVIFCRRDARDNCLSCYFVRFNKDNLLYTYDLVDCGQQWIETHRLADHWLKTLPLRMLEIHYETMVADLEGQSRRLIDFLGLPWDPACLEFHRTKRPVQTASAWQVRQPIYDRSSGRWRNYQRHLEPLMKVLEGRS